MENSNKQKEIKSKTIQVNLTENEHKTLCLLADEQQRTIAAQVRFWILEKLKIKDFEDKKKGFYSGKP